jgi:SAM-dependent methyltransferase
VKIQKCRLCESSKLFPVIDLGFHPLADTFLPETLLNESETSYPLQLGLCKSCGHVSTLFSVSAEDRYKKNEYSYDSSNSPVSIEHFKEFALTVVTHEKVSKDSLIVDIGSNVGTLLGHFKNLGFNNVLGVEPSKNISKIALENDIPTINEFFSQKATDQIITQGSVDLLVSSNVVNHIDNLLDLLNNAKKILSEGGIFVFEVPYLLDLIKNTAFDTIYHEHVHYFGIKPLVLFFHNQGFSIYKIEKLDYMCGSIRVFAKVGKEIYHSVSKITEEEEAFNLYSPATFKQFMERVRHVKFLVNSHLSDIRAKGGKIIGIGAATKGNTFLNYCRLDSDIISYVTDSSLLKIGKLTPGSHIPIVSDDDIDSEATHALILPWNIANYLQKKLSHLNLEFYIPQVNKV